jgi:hypothetical protein
MWEPQPLTTLKASKACRGENFTFIYSEYWLSLTVEMLVQVSFIDVLKYQINSDEDANTRMHLREVDLSRAHRPKFSRYSVVTSGRTDSSRR